MTTSALVVLTILFILVWLGFVIDQHPIGKRTSGVVWILVAAMLLSNSGVIPLASPTYDVIGSLLVPVSIPLLLLKADLRQIFAESGRVMLSFLLASVGTLFGAAIGLLFFDLGDEAGKIAGTYAGSWIGGAVNFVAVASAVELPPQRVSEALGAGAGVSITALMVLVALPSVPILARLLPVREPDGAEQDAEAAAAVPLERLVALRLPHLAAAISISLVICSAAWAIADHFAWERYRILLITLFAIIVANAAPRHLARMEGNFELGMFLMYLFFAAIGAGTDARSFFSSASTLFFYGLTLVLVHLIFVLIAARMFRLDLREAIIGSAAALVGPAPTAAIAAARGWNSLVTPGIMCGIFGYVIGTFLGVTLARVLGA